MIIISYTLRYHTVPLFQSFLVTFEETLDVLVCEGLRRMIYESDLCQGVSRHFVR